MDHFQPPFRVDFPRAKEICSGLGLGDLRRRRPKQSLSWTLSLEPGRVNIASSLKSYGESWGSGANFHGGGSMASMGKK